MPCCLRKMEICVSSFLVALTADIMHRGAGSQRISTNFDLCPAGTGKTSLAKVRQFGTEFHVLLLVC